MIEKTRLGAYLRAATENPALVGAFGINVPLMIMLTYGFGVALAGFAGVLAAPIYSVNPNMGADLIIVVFAVVVIGGMGSIMGAILTGYVPRPDRGADAGVLSRGLGRGDLRHHGDRADDQARRAVREDRLMAIPQTLPTPSPDCAPKGCPACTRRSSPCSWPCWSRCRSSSIRSSR